MNSKGFGRKRSWPRYYPRTCLKELRKSLKTLSQDSRSPGRDLNPGPPEYEAGVLTTRQRRSVLIYIYVCYSMGHSAAVSFSRSVPLHSITWLRLDFISCVIYLDFTLVIRWGANKQCHCVDFKLIDGSVSLLCACNHYYTYLKYFLRDIVPSHTISIFQFS
jgi:hypothetical protein